MNIEIEPKQILVYYDIPELFIAEDRINTKYICLFIKEINSFFKYVCVPVSMNTLLKFLKNKIDLRVLFEKPEIDVLYTFEIDSLSNKITLDIYSDENIQDWLPDTGFKIPKLNTDDNLSSETIKRNKTVAFLSISENGNSESVSINILSDILKDFQKIIKFAYRKALKNSHSKTGLNSEYIFKAFASSLGSYTIHLEAESAVDLLGYCEISKGLELFDNMVTESTDNNKVIEIMKANSGHIVANYKKFLQHIIDYDIDFSYKWAMPHHSEVHEKYIKKEYADKIYEILKLKEELEKEKREFIGYVVKADAERGDWRIHNVEDDKSYSGNSVNNQLAGIIIETKKYRFVCEEKIEEEIVSGKEKVSYILLDFHQID